jgi:AcrR family transcriptional regulator
MMGRPGPVLELFDKLPPRPPASLDRVLDAAERCLARYGIRRTSMTDIAREMNVARTTLYRQIGSVEEAMALIASRQFHRFLDELVGLLAGPAGPQAFIDAIAGAVRFARSHPVALRVLSDEPDILGELVSRDLRPYAEQIAGALSPIIEAAMKAGMLRPADPHLAAEWIVRVVAALVAVPPESDLDQMLEYALLPVLEPGPPRRATRR